MLPLKDDNPVRSVPIVTILIVVVNVLAFLYELQLGFESAGIERLLDRYAFDYADFTDGLTRHGPTLAVVTPLLAHMFLHSGLLHIAGNMLYLWVFGNNIEDTLGSLRFLLFYLASGVAAAIGQGILSPGPMIGASGAVAGVLGAYLVLFPQARVSTLVFLGIFITIVRLPALVVIGFWIVIQILNSLAELRITQHSSGGIAYFAHIAGFVAGIVLLQILRSGRSRYRLS